ncbi:hypothetical protein ECE50_004945 [Chitinophaga sp. Mgbs1]|uniref:Uncharacterized protein n=1 Tax=Chitinophaga solisilvae TaxID=1233460 RepID=A0A433WE67_9BACT|nr:hypothetical protein [Chitinophaga solisilvae]
MESNRQLNQALSANNAGLRLVYIPAAGEAVRFFRDAAGHTTEQQAAAFNAYVERNAYLRSRRGLFTERNMGRTPWNIQGDLHQAQEFLLPALKTHCITITADIINFTNMLNGSWGRQYFSPNTFNNTASVGLTPALYPPAQGKAGCPVYHFADPGTPYSINYFGSRYQMQLGVRYTF